jgi:hypothetical protein
MGVYDPLGMLAPITIQMELILRKVNECLVGWDEDIPVDLWEEFKFVMAELFKVKEFRKPRAIAPVGSQDRPHADLVTFVDASSSSMCAMSYLIVKQEGERHPSLLLTKTKIAPQPSPTVPKMELLAAQLGARITKKIEDELKNVNRGKVFPN